MGIQQHWRRHKAVEPVIAATPAPQQYLHFRAGQHQLAIAISAVRELLEWQPLTLLPRMQPPLCGILNLRGSGIPVIDLAQCLNLSASQAQRRSCIIILQAGTASVLHHIGILVDEVYAVQDIALDDIEPAPVMGSLLPADFIAGMLREAQGFTILLQAERLLSADDLGRLLAQSDASLLQAQQSGASDV